MVQFGYTILYVADVPAALAFYEQAFGFQRKFISPESDYAELITGTTTLSLCAVHLASTNLSDGFVHSTLHNKPFGIEMGMVTDDVDAVLKNVDSAGGIVIEAAKQKPWGQIVAYVRDLDGFLIEVCTSMA
jgi:lactoylglutathione lyase